MLIRLYFVGWGGLPFLSQFLTFFNLFNRLTNRLTLLLVSPASSVEAGRSFSALRRLKIWLRNTVTHLRLNSLTVFHVHQELLDLVDENALRELKFVSRNDKTRVHVWQMTIECMIQPLMIPNCPGVITLDTLVKLHHRML